RFASYLCSILKTSLELALAETVQLDLFVSHPICDAARNLAAIWGRNVDYPSQILYLPQNANSAYSAQYLREEYGRSLEVFNLNRALLRQLYAIKRERPWLCSADEAYALVAVGGMLPRGEHNHLLQTVLPLLEERPAQPQDRPRVGFEGG